MRVTFSHQCHSLSLSLSLFFFPPILNSIEHLIDFSLDEGHTQSISANGMTTTDELICSSVANSGLVTEVQSSKCHPTCNALITQRSVHICDENRTYNLR